MLFFLYALLLGVVQGITEFIPVSSSTHLKLVKKFLNIEPSLFFDLMCHVGTLIVLLLFFKKDLIELFIGKNKKRLLFFFCALTPLIPAYFLLRKIAQIEDLRLMGPMLFLSGIVLFLGSQKRHLPPEKPSVLTAFLVGLAQSVALIPGLSRSALTISSGRLLGFSAEEAVRFSFLLAIPTIFGGVLMELFFHTPVMDQQDLFSGLIGLISSGVTGFYTLKYALPLLEKGKLKPFAWYCSALGIIITAGALWPIIK